MITDEKVVNCDRCKLPITDVVYVNVSGALIKQKYLPQDIPIFRCKEHRENYAKTIDMHADCWIDTLKDHGVQLHDMKAILATMKEEANKANQEGENKNGLG